MNIIIDNKYIIEEYVDEGAFSKVFKAKHKLSNETIAIKIEKKNEIINLKNLKNLSLLKHEAKVYKKLSKIKGIPELRHIGFQENFNYLILPYFEVRIDSKEFSIKERISQLKEIIEILSCIHDEGIIHRDIKPENIMLKINEEKYNIFLIDFGLSKLIIDNQGIHIAEKHDKKFVGTAKFCSINNHKGIELSRRDDLESLIYTFIFLINKSLPWNKILIEKEDKKDEIYNKILEIKEGNSINDLNNIPNELFLILNYIKNLNFESRPNYNYLIGLLNNFISLF